MTLEIIIVGIFVVSMILAAFLAIHNIKELSKSRFEIDLLNEHNTGLSLENARLTYQIDELTRDLETERVNTKMLERALLDTIAPEEPESEPEPNAKERLPEGVATNRYDCEGFKFPAGTQQAKLQTICSTEEEWGVRYYLDRKYDMYLCVAMGGAYGIDIGDAWRVTLRNGAEFNVILADYQHDITQPDPDDFGERYEYDSAGNIVGPLRNYDGEECVHVLEFIADLDKLPQEAKDAGGMHGLAFFGGKFGDGGNIVKIKYLGRVWEP